MPPLGEITPERSFSVVVLPAPLGPEKGDELALLDLEVDAADGLDQAVLAAEQPADGGGQPFLLLIHPVGLRQPFDFNDRHNRNIIGPAGGRGEGKEGIERRKAE